MARIRTVKPSFFRHELLQELEMSHASLRPMLVFAGLWGHCDAAGRFAWKPRTLKLDILPFVEFEMSETLELLECHRLISRYEVDGMPFGMISSFAEHQRISGKEAESGEKFPDPPALMMGGSNGEALGKHRGKTDFGPSVDRGSTGEATGKQRGSNGEASGSAGKEQEGNRKGTGREQEPVCCEKAVTVETVIEEWNARSWSKKLLKVGEPIRKRIAARLREHPELDWWRTLFDQVGRSDFLSGRKTDFMATLFWVLGPDNLAKVEAGEYDNGERRLHRPKSLVGLL